jgi:predicted ester cyclase
MNLKSDKRQNIQIELDAPGLDGLKNILRGIRSVFPDLNFTIREQIAEGDKVASRLEWMDRIKQEFFRVPGTGRQFLVWAFVIDRLEEGRVRNTYIIMDTLGLMTQLGAFP